jgi:beta-glucanase (GH16 family)
MNMKKPVTMFSFIMAVILLFLFSSCSNALSENEEVSPLLNDEIMKKDGYTLIWSDEFDGDELNSDIWNYELGYIRNNELQLYTDSKENIRLENSMLIIEAKEGSSPDIKYTSASINTQNKKAFKYGMIEIKAKLPKGKGVWPAFWMMGNLPDSATGNHSWPQCGEIDILEMVGGGNGDATAYANLHWGDSYPEGYKNLNGTANSYKLQEGVFNDDFHIFGLKWTEKEMIWYIDDEEYFSAPITAPGMEMFHEEFFILLNLAIGGNWPGDPDENTEFPAQYLIDYVRVYQ